MPSPGNAHLSSKNKCAPCTYVLARFKLPPPMLAPPAEVENLGIPLLRFTLSKSLSVWRSRNFKLKTWVQNALGMDPGLTVATRWAPQRSRTHVPHWSSDAHRRGHQIFIQMAPRPSWKQNPPACRARVLVATRGAVGTAANREQAHAKKKKNSCPLATFPVSHKIGKIVSSRH